MSGSVLLFPPFPRFCPFFALLPFFPFPLSVSFYWELGFISLNFNSLALLCSQCWEMGAPEDRSVFPVLALRLFKTER